MRQSNRLHRYAMAAAVLSVGMIATPALAIEFPIHANDLVPGERISTAVHGTGGGPQTGAHDLLLQRWIADNNWSRLKAGQTNDAVNSNYLIYRRPVYAMASGTVIGCWRNAPENTGHNKRPEIGYQQDPPPGQPHMDQADGWQHRALCPCPHRRHPGQPVPATTPSS